MTYEVCAYVISMYFCFKHGFRVLKKNAFARAGSRMIWTLEKAKGIQNFPRNLKRLPITTMTLSNLL
jgi:hypothetical protein